MFVLYTSISNMAQARCFTVVGDSNVRRNLTKTNSRACPLMVGAQLLNSTRLEVFDEVLRKIRTETNVCILSCVTNFITSSDDDSMVSKRVEPVLDEFATHVRDAAQRLPAVQFMVAPPMYRQTPTWYREGLPEVSPGFQLN